MFVKGPPETGTPLWATLVCAPSSHGQWVVAASLQSSKSQRHPTFPVKAAKVPTQEFTQLLLLKVLALWSYYSNEHHRKQHHLRWWITFPISRWPMILFWKSAEAGQPCSISSFQICPTILLPTLLQSVALCSSPKYSGSTHSSNFIHMHLVTAIICSGNGIRMLPYTVYVKEVEFMAQMINGLWWRVEKKWEEVDEETSTQSIDRQYISQLRC